MDNVEIRVHIEGKYLLEKKPGMLLKEEVKQFSMDGTTCSVSKHIRAVYVILNIWYVISRLMST